MLSISKLTRSFSSFPFEDPDTAPFETPSYTEIAVDSGVPRVSGARGEMGIGAPYPRRTRLASAEGDLPCYWGGGVWAEPQAPTYFGVFAWE